ncbi:hypothetical protein M8C21_014902, partial [Ambrosia artemisiifolia]
EQAKRIVSVFDREVRYAVVTGANKGIGFETVGQLAASGVTVLLPICSFFRIIESVMVKDYAACLELCSGGSEVIENNSGVVRMQWKKKTMRRLKRKRRKMRQRPSNDNEHVICAFIARVNSGNTNLGTMLLCRLRFIWEVMEMIDLLTRRKNPKFADHYFESNYSDNHNDDHNISRADFTDWEKDFALDFIYSCSSINGLNDEITDN